MEWLLEIVFGVLAYLKPLVPSPARVTLALKNMYLKKPIRSEDRFRIALCWLENDYSGNDTNTVERAFRDVEGVTLVRSARIVKASGAADDWRLSMRKRARTVLEDWNADLVVAGFVNKPEKVLSLWLVPYEGEGTLYRGDRQHYQLEKEVKLGEDFREDIRTELVTTALAAVAPLADNETRGRVLEQGLLDSTAKLQTLLEGSTIKQSEHRAALQTALGSALSALGERESGSERLAQAVAAYQTALEVFTREHKPIVWAATQINLGNALRTLGDRESGTKRLEQAVEAYEGVLEVQTRKRAPLDWAMTQNNLGNALQTMAKREDGSERVKEAVAAYRAALEECKRFPASAVPGRSVNALSLEASGMSGDLVG